LRRHQSLSYSRIPQHFMEPEASLPCSQEHFTDPPIMRSQLNPVHPTPSYISKIHLILSSHLRLGFPSGLFFLAFPQKSYMHSSSPHAYYIPCPFIQMSQEERSILWEVIVSVVLSKKNGYMYTCPVPNGFRDRATSLDSYKIVYKKQILRKVKVKLSLCLTN
jgi:hypothetical protein